MKSSLPTLFALAAALVFSGCATHTKEQIAEIRAAKVSPGVVAKLERHGRLTPEDLIELKRRRVNDSIPLKQLNDTGVDYVVDKADVKKMRAGGVSDEVIRATIAASNRFTSRFYDPIPFYSYGYGWAGPYGPLGPWGYPYGPYFRDPWWPYGGPRYLPPPYIRRR